MRLPSMLLTLSFATITAAACGEVSDPALDGGPAFHSSSGGGSTAQDIPEREPNSGQSQSELQILPTFNGALQLRITGRLESGGYDAQQPRYTGDVDRFDFELTVPGDFSVLVDWEGGADVDVFLSTNQVLASDVRTGMGPAQVQGGLGTGWFALSIVSADQPANYTATITFQPQQQSGGSSSGGPATGGVLDAECTHSTNYGLDTVYIFWPDNSYVMNHEYTNIGTWDREEEGSYGINGNAITFAPNGAQPRTESFQQDNNVEVYIGGELYLCFDR